MSLRAESATVTWYAARERRSEENRLELRDARNEVGRVTEFGDSRADPVT